MVLLSTNGDAPAANQIISDIKGSPGIASSFKLAR
jgi:hypothetical protein